MVRRGLRVALARIPTYSQELGLDLRKPADRFKWLLASVLFAKRISAEIAKRTFREFERRGYTTPESIQRAGWDALVDALDAGGYVRYDFSTASILLDLVKALQERGGLEHIYRQARNSSELERDLMRLKGIGPVAVNIFLRELRGVWPKAKTKPCALAERVAKKLELSEVSEFESALVRVGLEFCKRRACGDCPVKEWCSSGKCREKGSF